MTAVAAALCRAVRPIPPTPLLAVRARHIERVAAAPGAEGVDRTLDGRGPATNVLGRQGRVPVRARAQRPAAKARDDRTTSPAAPGPPTTGSAAATAASTLRRATRRWLWHCRAMQGCRSLVMSMLLDVGVARQDGVLEPGGC